MLKYVNVYIKLIEKCLVKGNLRSVQKSDTFKNVCIGWLGKRVIQKIKKEKGFKGFKLKVGLGDRVV